MGDHGYLDHDVRRERAVKGLLRADCFSLSYVEVSVLVVLLTALL